MRNPDKLKDIKGIEIIKAQLRDEEEMKTAIRGKDGVLVAIGTHNYFSMDRTCSNSTKAIIAAMKETGVKRIVVLSSYGAGPGNRALLSWFPRSLLGYILDDKDKQEEIIMKSGLDYTIVRPPRLLNKPAKGNIFVTTALSFKLPVMEISRADVAAFMLESAT